MKIMYLPAGNMKYSWKTNLGFMLAREYAYLLLSWHQRDTYQNHYRSKIARTFKKVMKEIVIFG
jgi:hypothetical protein